MRKVVGKIVRFIFKFLMVFFIVLFVAGCGIGGYIGFKILPKLDEYKQVAYEKFDSIGPNTFTYLQDTVIYDKDNNVITELNIGNYKYVDIDEVSDWVQEGYVAVEDKRFKVHNGIDYKALARASIAMLKNRGNATQGGSTITQQVIKNNLLTQEKTFERKITEFFLAPEFEKKYSKKDIMEFYVNTNFYGNNCYGIEAASQYYFGKSAAELSIGESALFVGMSNNATLYNPKTNYDLTMEKWRFVLGEMRDENVISQEDYENALKEGLEFVYYREGREKENYLTSYAIHCTVLELMNRENFEFKYLFADEAEYNDYQEKYNSLYNEFAEKVRAGGYTIYTSLDSQMQDKIQKIIDRNALSYSKEIANDDSGRFAFQSATVIVNNETGYVEAIIGGRGTDDEYNRGFLAKRQPGSSIKPLVVYAPAYNSGMYYPSLIMTDEDDPSDEYYPKNYSGGFIGRISIREAVGRSTNTIAYQIMKNIGANRGLEYLAEMKFDTMSNVDNNNTAVALGGFTYGVRVEDMAKGYSTLVNNGNYIDNTCIIKIEYQNEGEIFNEDSELISVFEPDAAYMMVDSCKTVLYEDYGTATNRKPDNAIAMAKSGTTDDTKDAWFCGSSVYYSVAVWCGFDTPRSTNLTGGSLPAKMWKEIMEELHNGKEERDFDKPETIVMKPINTNGTIASRDTGIYDMFSQALLDKAEAERRAILEQKKIDADNQLISEIDTSLINLRKYIITDIDSLSYLTNRFSNLANSISTVYQESQKERLELEITKIENYFALDIRNMQAYNSRQIKLEEVKKAVEFEQSIVDKLNELNAFLVLDRSDINTVESMYAGIDKLLKKADVNVQNKYKASYDEIKKYKEISLKPYRQEIEEEKRQECLNAEECLKEYLTELDAYLEYSEDVEDVFKKIEKQMDYCNSIGVNVSSYYSDYISEKDFILRTKPTPTPSVTPSVVPSPNVDIEIDTNIDVNIGQNNETIPSLSVDSDVVELPIVDDNFTNDGFNAEISQGIENIEYSNLLLD